MIAGGERSYVKEQALLCCDLYIAEGQTALEHKVKEYNFADKLIIELLCQVYVDVKTLQISPDEGKYKQNSILGVCEISDEEE